MFDACEHFASALTAGGHIKALRVDRVSGSIVELMEETGCRVVMATAGHERKRVKYYSSPTAAPEYVSLSGVGYLMRALWVKKFFWGRSEGDVLVQDAASKAVWAGVARNVCRVMSVRGDAASAAKVFVTSRLQLSEGNYLLREEVLDAFIKQHPGPVTVRARELSSALRSEGLSDLSLDPRLRINGISTRIVPGVAWKSAPSTTTFREDNPFL